MATVTRVTDLGDDILQVDGVDADGNDITATGWVSAMSNYYPPTAYLPDGTRKPTAVPRPMTAKEQHAYWLSLLGDVAPTPDTAGTVLYQA